MDNIEKLVAVLKRISQFQKPGKKTLHKIVYLLERKGIDLGFGYSIHYYGPYSSELDFAVHSLVMQGVLEIIKDGMTHRISLTENADLLGEDARILFDENQLRLIDEIISSFANKSAHDLEVLTTTDYVAQQIMPNGNPGYKEKIIEGVRKIKGNKFSLNKIKETITVLEQNGYF